MFVCKGDICVFSTFCLPIPVCGFYLFFFFHPKYYLKYSKFTQNPTKTPIGEKWEKSWFVLENNFKECHNQGPT